MVFDLASSDVEGPGTLTVPNGMELLLWAEDPPISYEDRGKIYKREFTGVVRKLNQLYVEKDEDQLAGVQLAAYERLFNLSTCPDCKGARLNQESLAVRLADGSSISDLIDWTISL